MNSVPLIFCDAVFEARLRSLLPEATVIAFAGDTRTCQARISALDDQRIRQVVMLYAGTRPTASNLPVKDHINLSRQNPLIGPADLSKGPRFPDMSSVYDSDAGVIVVQGEDEALEDFQEDYISVERGVWEAIALKHRGYSLQAWIISDLEKWISETSLFN